ncbi:hypothetical protein CD111_05570 [Mammaliicoccus stepanovicii]|nr:hypothetical protein CD111_05570 [Mammaliicoccus stepanovicii]
MRSIDKRGKLSEDPFSYQITKKRTVRIFFGGKEIKILKDAKAEQLIKKMEAVDYDDYDVQLLLAKVTGNFKHGNEKVHKSKY